MTLSEAIEQYVLWRQAHGAKFTTTANLLRRFLRHADGDAGCDTVTTAQVLAFLAGKGPLTRDRENKYSALAGFWRYAISRGYARCSPLPDDEPRLPLRAPPHIYARDELQRLLDPRNVEASRHWAAPQRGHGAHAGGCGLVGSHPDHPKHKILQKPSGPCGTTALGGAG